MTIASEPYCLEGHSKDIKVIHVHDITGFSKDIRVKAVWDKGTIDIEWHKSRSLTQMRKDPKQKEKLKNLEAKVEQVVRNFVTGCYEKHLERNTIKKKSPTTVHKGIRPSQWL